MNDTISRQAAIECLDDEITVTGEQNAIEIQNYIRRVGKRLNDLPSVQPEQELLKDGTLVVKTDFDMTKFDRVNVIQNGTHYGDLFYQDDDTRRKGKWIPHQSKYGIKGEMVYECSYCGENVGFYPQNFCPYCGSYNGGEQE